MMKFLGALFLYLNITLSAAPSWENFQWHTIQINGKKYVPLSDIKEFYEFDSASTDGKKITLDQQHTSATFTLNEQASSINGVTFILSEPIRAKNNLPHLSQLDLSTLIDPLFRPRFIKNAQPVKTIILDPGHGGKDQGAAGEEAKHTLAVAIKAKALLEKKGYLVVMTRETDISVSLAERIRIANTHENAAMISLHFNSGNTRAHGLETYIMSARNPGKIAKIHASIALASATHSQTLQHLGNDTLHDRGIKRARFNILSGCKHPTIYIEAGFLTNKKDKTLIRTEKFQTQLAESILQGIEVYNTSLKKGR